MPEHPWPDGGAAVWHRPAPGCEAFESPVYHTAAEGEQATHVVYTVERASRLIDPDDPATIARLNGAVHDLLARRYDARPPLIQVQTIVDVVLAALRGDAT